MHATVNPSRFVPDRRDEVFCEPCDDGLFECDCGAEFDMSHVDADCGEDEEICDTCGALVRYERHWFEGNFYEVHTTPGSRERATYRRVGRP